MFPVLTFQGGGGSPDWVAKGHNVYVLCAEPKEHKQFRPGTRPAGSVTWVTKKLFMCQMFMCLFCPLEPYSDKEISLEDRALKRLPCELGSQVGIH